VWQAAQDALIAGDARELGRLLREHEALFRTGEPPPYNAGGLAPDYAGGDAQAIIVRNHDFDSWDQVVRHLDALADPDSPIARFETAVDAVVNGDAGTLRRLLTEDPSLVRARSTRRHHATLLNYVGANGVEAHRQQTPANAVEIARLLLDAGAEIDAAGDMYRGTTTLGLVATSIQPLQAGVQTALITFLLDRGASLARAVAPDYRDGNLIDACLANGRPEAAAFLASRGAPLTLAGAAGTGRLDMLETFFEESGRAKPGVTQEQLLEATTWAATYSPARVVAFLLEHGVDPAAKLPGDGQTALHAAAYGGQTATVKLLLARHVPVDPVDDSYRATPLGWALYGWSVTPTERNPARFYDVVRLLVNAGSRVEPRWLEWDRVIADSQMLAALGRG
jgi:ankyrin repeat protein